MVSEVCKPLKAICGIQVQNPWDLAPDMAKSPVVLCLAGEEVGEEKNVCILSTSAEHSIWRASMERKKRTLKLPLLPPICAFRWWNVGRTLEFGFNSEMPTAHFEDLSSSCTESKPNLCPRTLSFLPPAKGKEAVGAGRKACMQGWAPWQQPSEW